MEYKNIRFGMEDFMGRIDMNGGMDRTLERRHIELMLRYKEEYEEVKRSSIKSLKQLELFTKREVFVSRIS